MLRFFAAALLSVLLAAPASALPIEAAGFRAGAEENHVYACGNFVLLVACAFEMERGEATCSNGSRSSSFHTWTVDAWRSCEPNDERGGIGVWLVIQYILFDADGCRFDTALADEPECPGEIGRALWSVDWYLLP